MQTIKQFPAWFSRQKPFGKLAIGCGGLSLFFCLCLFSIAIVSPTPTTAEAASTKLDISGIQTSVFETAVAGVYQTATANAPTITPFPTITLTPNIPTNTASPVPTETHPATTTPEPDLYPIIMNEKVQAYAAAYFQVVEYNQQVADDISLLWDDKWKMKQGIALGTLELCANEMAAVQPSPRFDAFHAIIVKLAGETHLFTTAYISGVDNLDPDQIDLATQHMQNMTNLMEQATAELKKIQAGQ